MMNLTKSVLALPLLIALTLSSGLARAQGSSMDDAERLAQEARVLMDEGVEAMSQQKQREAYEAMKKSFELRRSFDIACNLGLLESEFEKFPQAATHLQYCLHNYPTGGNWQKFTEIRGLYEKVTEQVGALRVVLSPLGAELFVDDEPVGDLPKTNLVFVEPGEHIVRATLGDESADQGVVAQKGKTVDLNLALPSPSASVPAGEAVRRGGDAPLQRKRPSLVPVAVLGGTTAALFGVSMLLRGLAGSQSKKYDDALDEIGSVGCAGMNVPSACDALTDYSKKHDNLVRSSNATLIASGAVASAAVGYLTYALVKRKKNRQLGASASIDRDGAAFFLQGQF